LVRHRIIYSIRQPRTFSTRVISHVKLWILSVIPAKAGIVNDLIDSFGQLDFLIDLLEQEDTGVGSEFSVVEVDVDWVCPNLYGIGRLGLSFP